MRHEAEELKDVASVGLARLPRHAPLGGQMLEPPREFADEFRRRKRQIVGLSHRSIRDSRCRIITPGRCAFVKMRFLSEVRMDKRIVEVLVPVALDHTYSYRVPDDLELGPGDLVGVPLGASETLGVVWATDAVLNPRLDNRLKDVEEKLGYPPLKPELRKFIDWVADYTLPARGTVLRMCLRMGAHLGPERVRIGLRLAGPPPRRMTAARERVLALLIDGLARPKGEAAEEAGVSVGVIDALIDAGTLQALPLPPAPVARAPDPSYAAPDLTEAQRTAAEAVRASIHGGFSVTLVDGVTGSGKTEVYFEAVAENIRRGRQTLILMPEIALTGQFLDRFAQ